MWGSLFFQESVSPLMEQLELFHNHVMLVLVFVMFMVGYILLVSVQGLWYVLGNSEAHFVEFVWTVLPVVVLLFIAFPSLRLLYLMEECWEGDVVVSVMGYQWYWSYEVDGVSEGEIESYLDSEGLFRNLGVDNYLVLPYNSDVRVLVSSMDVIHSWSVPSLGVSVDAIPGRLNQVGVWFNSGGWYVGQCSEICGVNHSFMPIFIKVVGREDFLS